MDKPKLLFVAPDRSTFIMSDLALVQNHFRVKAPFWSWTNPVLLPLNLFRQWFWLCWQAPSAHAMLVSFGGYWALLPAFFGKVLRKPVYIILHGTDSIITPYIGYGSIRKPLVRWFCKWAYHWATALLPVSDSLIRGTNRYHDPAHPEEFGVQHYFPSVNTPTQTIHNGLDEAFWTPGDSQNRLQKRFVAVMGGGQFLRKGGDMICQVAHRFPDCTFHIAGMEVPKGESVPTNVVFLGRLTPEQLREEYRMATYHLQLAVVEAFGLAVCEAMLCGCVPIVSSVNELPSIAGDVGYVVEQRKSEVIALAIDRALEGETEYRGKAARERIMKYFDLNKREKTLKDVLMNQV